jgi:hypothetical protein
VELVRWQVQGRTEMAVLGKKVLIISVIRAHNNLDNVTLNV